RRLASSAHSRAFSSSESCSRLSSSFSASLARPFGSSLRASASSSSILMVPILPRLRATRAVGPTPRFRRGGHRPMNLLYQETGNPRHQALIQFLAILRVSSLNSCLCPHNAPAQPRRAHVRGNSTPHLPTADGCSGWLGVIHSTLLP